MIGQMLDHYRVVREIGRGAMGVVYLAHDENLPRDVALKVLPAGALATDADRKRFRKEAVVLSQLNHPNIATVHDYDTQDGIDFLVMEYIPGMTLAEKLESGALPEEETIRLGIQLGQGLTEAHKKGVGHHDLKPGNIRITPNGWLKVLDFGLAQFFPGTVATATTRSTAGSPTGRAAGTLPYMAPEQLRCETTDPRTDIYAAGAVLYEMIAGRRPFPQRQQPQLIAAILREAPPPPSSVARVSAGLDRVILKALDKDPDLRYQSAKELEVDLERASGGGPLPPPPPDWIERGLVALVVLFAALAIFLYPPTPKLKILVVLPCQVIAGGAEDKVDCDGLLDTVTAKLARVRSLQVPSAKEVRERGVDSIEKARTELAADLVLTGSWQRSDPKVRINLSVVEARRRQQLASDTITESGGDPFARQDRVVESVLGMLEVEVHSHETQELKAHGTSNPAAYRDYSRGRAYLLEYPDPKNIESAIGVFRHATELDPNFGLAYAGLGEAYWRKYRQSRHTNWVSEALDNCKRAISLDNRRAHGYVCLGQVYTETGKYAQAVEQFEKAVQLEPSHDAYKGLALAYERLGRPEEAEKTYRRAIDMNPNYWAGYSSLGAFYYGQARYGEAAEMFGKVVELASDSFRGYSNLAGIYILQGRYAEAISKSERSLAIAPSDKAYNQLAMVNFYLRRFTEAARDFEQAAKLAPRNFKFWGNLGDACYWAPGRREEAIRAYRKAISLLQEQLKVNPHDGEQLAYLASYHAMLEERKPAFSYLEQGLAEAPGDPDVQFRAAQVHIRFGEVDRALDWLEKAVAARFSPNMVRDDPIFDNLQSNPRFQKLLRERESVK